MLVGEGALSPRARGGPCWEEGRGGRPQAGVGGALAFPGPAFMEACRAVPERTSAPILLVLEVAGPICDLDLNSLDNYRNEGP